jgi:uncharacterized protein
LLLAHGANINAKNGIGATPLKLAAIIGNENVILELLQNGADMTARDYYGTALDWARRLHREKNAELLVKHGAKMIRQ